MSTQPKAAPLWVDPVVHAAECARFDGYIVRGPNERDCDISSADIGADGFYIYRAGLGLCVRAHRYALARTLGTALGGDVLALHDNPLCVKISPMSANRQHLVP